MALPSARGAAGRSMFLRSRVLWHPSGALIRFKRGQALATDANGKPIPAGRPRWIPERPTPPGDARMSPNSISDRYGTEPTLTLISAVQKGIDMADPHKTDGAPPRSIHIEKKKVNWLAWIALIAGILALLLALSRLVVTRR